mmetsp:Transcript_48172/g.65603  ORF Transcript_48172/g.65603 Transcript_48172/m.65603 type:complete len:117 (-) Transcript_48172:25-375(-)
MMLDNMLRTAADMCTGLKAYEVLTTHGHIALHQSRLKSRALSLRIATDAHTVPPDLVSRLRRMELDTQKEVGALREKVAGVQKRVRLMDGDLLKYAKTGVWREPQKGGGKGERRQG